MFVKVEWNNAEFYEPESYCLRDIKKSCSDPLKGKRYNLLAFCNYKPGHYQAFCYRPNNKWWVYDDVLAHEYQVDDSVLVTPYLLMMVRS